MVRSEGRKRRRRRRIWVWGVSESPALSDRQDAYLSVDRPV